MPQDLLLLAMPCKLPKALPHPGSVDGLGALLYRRSHGARKLRLEACLDLNNQVAPIRVLPLRARKLSGRGIIDGKYGWPRPHHTPGFTDWTIYGRTSKQDEGCSDAFIFTQDFVAHGQHDLSGASVHPKIKRTRYGAPLYQLDGEAPVLPIYLKSSLVPPSSAHERMRYLDRYQPQISMILDLLGLSNSAAPELTWLHSRNYP